VTITVNCAITSDVTRHRAWNTGSGNGEVWRVSWNPSQAYTHEQAITAMYIAELVGSNYASPQDGITSLPGWAIELGLTASDAVRLLLNHQSWGYAVRHSTLPWQHKSLLLLLGTYLDTDGTYHRPAASEISDVAGLGEQDTVDLLMELEAAGWFSWHTVTGTDVNGRSAQDSFAPVHTGPAPPPPAEAI
jgi:hypothetical protein